MSDINIPEPSATVRRSLLFSGIVNSGRLADVDSLLDWRNRLRELSKEGEYPAEYYEFEIQAVDYQLDLHNAITT